MIEPQVGTAVSLWMEVGLDILDEFENKNWKISFQDVTDAFNEAFWYHDIRFFLADNPTKDNFRKYIECGLFHYDGLIEIYLREELLPFLQRLRFKKDYMSRWINFGKNRFLEEYLEVVSHELLHRKQWELGLKYGRETNSNGVLDKDHFSDPSEIQAHAQDAALALAIDRSLISQTYFIAYYRDIFGPHDPVFKTFMKNLQRFLEKMIEDQIHLLF